MKVVTLHYNAKAGWSEPLPRALDSEQTAVIVFGAPELEDEVAPFVELAAAFPTSKVVGCSSAGEIFEATIRDRSLCVAVVRFEHTSLRLAEVQVSSAGGSGRAAAALAGSLIGSDLRAVLVLSDGIHVNGSRLAANLSQNLPEEVAVFGGLAGDGSRFQKTWVLAGNKPRSGMIAGLGFYGPRLRVHHGSRGGWDKFGPERKVTRAQANVLHEVDGEPALDLYKRYLGERATELPAAALLFPLAMRNNAAAEDALVRTILSIDEKSKSMRFAGDIPLGTTVQLMRANFDRLIEGASNAALSARPGDGGADSLTIAISCVGRRLVLGERAEEEVEAVAEVMPKSARQIGFYSYGELSPLKLGKCELHNQTMTLASLAEV